MALLISADDRITYALWTWKVAVIMTVHSRLQICNNWSVVTLKL
ncbi:hypothetical protein DJICPGNB_24795 [Klebsiella pneumoniae]|nr:hypothetical protein DJICPGNB_26025 [Klebsiella pneumoniae]CAI6215360.1 hypothetical protein DJICPGNB_26745 [Klebsiella pneumoniae]SWP83173.1 Uncharacterised protein [Klebsiella pneumoniae]SXU58803.1 Uncharacterised protein [Klebsiella pneumoniae]